MFRQLDELVQQEKRKHDTRELETEEAAWARLEGQLARGQVGLGDLPGLSAAAMRARLDKGEAKKVFKELNLRWHPDKFMPKYGAVVPAAQVDAVREAVTKTWRNLRGYHMKYEEGLKASSH